MTLELCNGLRGEELGKQDLERDWRASKRPLVEMLVKGDSGED